jgi:molybdopterin molybdotransferase
VNAQTPTDADAIDCEALIGFDAAQALLAAHALPLGVETVPLAKAGRRILAEPLRARINSPRAHTAAMDGYAVRGNDLDAGMRKLRVAGSHHAGGSAAPPLEPGSAVRIMTGTPMPAGADRVVMLEHVHLEGDDVVLPGQPSLKAHVRLRASDFAVGEELLPAGRVIDPRAMLIAAAADAAELTMWRRPRVGCIASGDELADPGSASAELAAVPDCLSEAVMLLCHQWGGKPVGGVRVADGVAAIRAAAETMLPDCDVLVLIGGASRGDRDFARAGLHPLGLEIVFSDVAIKPGKPVWYGRIGRHHVLGLPGNPTAAMTVARLFLAPLLAALSGQGTRAAMTPTMLPLAADAPTASREQFLCGFAEAGAVRVVERQAASSQLMLRNAEMLVRLPGQSELLRAGTNAATFRF